MTSATPTKLRSGDWGARVSGRVRVTATPVAVDLDVAKMSQEDRSDIAERLLYVGEGAWLCSRASDGRVLTGREGVSCSRPNGIRPYDPLTLADPSEAGVLEVLRADRHDIAAGRYVAIAQFSGRWIYWPNE